MAIDEEQSDKEHFKYLNAMCIIWSFAKRLKRILSHHINAASMFGSRRIS
jgi:hypothetical protein